MSQANSVFYCRTCNKKLEGKSVAYRHLMDGYGMFMDESLEEKFLQEEGLLL